MAEYFHATSTTATSTFAGGLSAAGTSGLTVLQNGNVGVGTVSPQSRLHVDGGSGQYGTTTLMLGDSGWSSPGSVDTGLVDGSKIEIFRSRDNLGQLGMNNNGDIWMRTGGTQASGYRFYTANDNTNSPTERFTILNGGNVGIGTTSPTQLLHIESAAPMAVVAMTGTAGVPEFRFNEAGSTVGAGLFYRGSTNSTDPGQLMVAAYGATGNIGLRTSGSEKCASRLRATSVLGHHHLSLFSMCKDRLV